MKSLAERIRTDERTECFDSLFDKVMNPTGWDASPQLIEGILCRIPVPKLICETVFHEDEKGLKHFQGFRMLGNSQRIWGSIASYFVNCYKLHHLKLFPDLDGKYFDDLHPAYRRRIEEVRLPLIVIETYDKEAGDFVKSYYETL